MKLRASRKVDSVIPTAAMADIAFLLIIFFMVTTVHEVDRTSVNLPLAKSREDEEAEKGSAIVVLGKDKDGLLQYKFSNGDAMSHLVRGTEDIYLEASQLTYGDPSLQFILKADSTVPYEKVDELLDTLRKADVTRVLLQCQQDTGKK